MKENGHRIRSVLPDSIAEEMNIEPGDVLLSVNGQEIEDIFDYRFLTSDEEITVLIRKQNGEEWELDIEKDQGEDLGMDFESGLMDDYRSCQNHCIFCFIDQMPKGMRPTLYFKDDDSRLSFLQGNYVTLTNMSDHDIDRIIRYRMEPINISFQTTNPELRVKMLHNRFAGGIFPKVKRLADAGIEMNGQIVLCRGINDGDELERSIRDLTAYLPSLRSVSVVPVGLSKFRDGLYPLEPFTKEDAEKVIDQIERWQNKLYPQYGIHFIHASDEWYLLAGRELPEAERYDGYLQLENGVGMLRLLTEEVREYLEKNSLAEESTSSESGSGQGAEKKTRRVIIATGVLAAETIRVLSGEICHSFENLQVEVVPVRNDFFGTMITVSGLITGQDLIRQLKDYIRRKKEAGEPPADEILIPCNMLRSGEDVFLDDVTTEQAERELGIPLRVVDEGGEAFCRAVLGLERNTAHKRRQMYEQTDCSDSGET
ncbi:MAG: DUF512 domain-containing protein [Eubacteriales bacterium]|jgi:putative radical SAM enzyme (TIGR03279 family)